MNNPFKWESVLTETECRQNYTLHIAGLEVQLGTEPTYSCIKGQHKHQRGNGRRWWASRTTLIRLRGWRRKKKPTSSHHQPWPPAWACWKDTYFASGCPRRPPASRRPACILGDLACRKPLGSSHIQRLTGLRASEFASYPCSVWSSYHANCQFQWFAFFAQESISHWSSWILCLYRLQVPLRKEVWLVN